MDLSIFMYLYPFKCSLSNTRLEIYEINNSYKYKAPIN